MMKSYLWILILVLFVVCGCTGREANRYQVLKKDAFEKNDEEWKSTKEKPHVTIYSYPEKTSAQTPMKITDLSSEAQAAYIERIWAYAKNSDDLRKELAKPLSKTTSREEISPLEFKRTLVISVFKGLGAKPGERLQWTEVVIKPEQVINEKKEKESAFDFTGYTVAETETDTLNIADITSTKSITFRANAKPSFAGISGGGIEGEATKKQEVKKPINVSYTKMHIDIQPNRLQVIRKSEQNIEVDGNTIIKLSIKRKDSSKNSVGYRFVARNLNLKKDSEAIELNLEELHDNKELKADVILYYIMRKINSGGATYIEGDDYAYRYFGKHTADQQVLIRSDELRKPLWKICAKFNNPKELVLAKGEGKNIKNATNSKGTLYDIFAHDTICGSNKLVFTSYLDAWKFATWFKDSPTGRINGYSFTVGKDKSKKEIEKDEISLYVLYF